MGQKVYGLLLWAFPHQIFVEFGRKRNIWEKKEAAAVLAIVEKEEMRQGLILYQAVRFRLAII